MYIFGQYIDVEILQVCNYFVIQVLFEQISLAVLGSLIPLDRTRYIVGIGQGIIQLFYAFLTLPYFDVIAIQLCQICLAMLIMQIIVYCTEAWSKKRKDYIVVKLRPGDYGVVYEKGYNDANYPLNAYEQEEGKTMYTQIHAGTNVILTQIENINPNTDTLKLLCQYRQRGYDSLDYWSCSRVLSIPGPTRIVSVFRQIVALVLIGIVQFMLAILSANKTGFIYLSSDAVDILLKNLQQWCLCLIVYALWDHTRKHYGGIVIQIVTVFKWAVAVYAVYQLILAFNL